MNFLENLFKTGLSFIANLALLYFINMLHWLIIAIIQCVFFATFYYCLDKVIDKIKKRKSVRNIVESEA